MAFTKETLKHFWEHIDFLKANKDDVISVDLTNNEKGIDSKNIFDLIYPVGSYYWSKNSTSPNKLFGGVWEQVKDTFILAAGDNYSVGAIGGEAEHTLIIEELPYNTQELPYINTDSLAPPRPDTVWAISAQTTSNYDRSPNFAIKAGGLGYSHNNMPPYRVAYCWCRVG